MAPLDLDVARIILERADRFYDAAQLQAQSHAPQADIEANLKRAINSYQRALTFYMPASYPSEFGRILTNLGNAFLSLAEMEDPEANLEQAVRAFNEVLSVYTRGTYPAQHATTQSNLGNAYGRLAQHKNQAANLERAIRAQTEALDVYTRAAFPVQYAMVNFHLGLLYRQRGDLPQAARALAEAEQVSRQQGMVRWAEQALAALDAVQEQLDKGE